jgi:hypothetical protein
MTKLVEKYKRQPVRMWMLHRALVIVSDPDTFQVKKLLENVCLSLLSFTYKSAN